MERKTALATAAMVALVAGSAFAAVATSSQILAGGASPNEPGRLTPLTRAMAPTPPRVIVKIEHAPSTTTTSSSSVPSRATTTAPTVTTYVSAPPLATTAPPATVAPVIPLHPGEHPDTQLPGRSNDD